MWLVVMVMRWLLVLLFLNGFPCEQQQDLVSKEKRKELRSLLRAYENNLALNCSLQHLNDILSFASSKPLQQLTQPPQPQPQALQYSNLLVTTPCLSSQSFGNFLSDYIESRICAHLSGLHLISLSHVNQTKLDLPSYLPKIIYHHSHHSHSSASTSTSASPSASSHGLEYAKRICICYSICHENPYALLHSYPTLISDILRPVILKYYSKTMKASLSFDQVTPYVFKSTLRQPYDVEKPIFPSIPDAAIHYRCGDNTVGHYGFLAFPAFLHTIPTNTSTIYVLAEKSSRKFTQRRTERCDSVLTALWEYLTNSFPSSTILVLRGANIFDDFSRLALSQVSVCSVSTFCFYAALATAGKAYLPITRLFAKATTPDYGPRIKWLDNFPTDSVILGDQILKLSDSELVNRLKTPRGARPTPPSYINFSKRPIPKYVVPE